MSGSKPGAALPVIADQRFLGNFSGAPALPAATEIVAGSNIVLTPTPPNQLIIAATTGSTASGTVVQVNTGTGLTGGPITVSGTVSLAAFSTGFFLGNFSGGSVAPVPVALTVGSGVTYSAVTDSVTVSLAPIADQRFLGNYSGGSLAPQAVQLVAGSGITFAATTTTLTLTATTPTPALVLISELTTAVVTASFTFSSITSSYRDLIVRVRGRGSIAATEAIIRMQLNGDGGSNYNSERGYFVGGGTFAAEALATTSALMGSVAGGNATANYAGSFVTNIMDYIGTTFFKSFHSRGGESFNTSANNTNFNSNGGLWLSTSAVTSITIFPQTGSFVTGSIATLYGHL